MSTEFEKQENYKKFIDFIEQKRMITDYEPYNQTRGNLSIELCDSQMDFCFFDDLKKEAEKLDIRLVFFWFSCYNEIFITIEDIKQD